VFGGVRDELKRLVADLDPCALAPRDAVRVLRELVELKRLVGAAELVVLARASDSPVWRQAGARSPAHWLARQSGTTVGCAVKALDTAERLESLPATEAALRDGQLSADQVVAIADAATADPAAEQALIARARSDSVMGLRAECDRVKAAALSDAGLEERQHAARALRHRADPLRGFVLEANATPAAGAELLAHLAPFERAAFEAARIAGRRESKEAYAFDALLAMARAAGGSQNAGCAPHKVIVRIDHAALVRGGTEAGETAEIAGVGPVPVATVRRIIESGDAFLAAVVTKGRDVCTVAHAGRRPSAVQLSALEWLHRSCVVEGCNATVGLEYDHHADWAKTFRTHLAELGPLCAFHHDQKTHRGFALADGSIQGKKRLLPPDDPDPPPP
jgi:hypothetical protein